MSELIKTEVRNIIENRISENICLNTALLSMTSVKESIARASEMIVEAYQQQKKIYLCGNGGSASDALHMAGELVGRFQKERRALSAIVLNADVVSMTAISNDYSFDDIYARQLSAHMEQGDILIGFSTSGNSVNIIKAALIAQKTGGKVIGLLGSEGGHLLQYTNCAIVVPAVTTARIQEAHILIAHILCEIIEERMV